MNIKCNLERTNLSDLYAISKCLYQIIGTGIIATVQGELSRGICAILSLDLSPSGEVALGADIWRHRYS